MKKICVIGSGSWGCALAVHLAKLGNEIKVWSFSKEEADIINNEKKCKFLPGVDLPDNIYCTTDLEEAIKDTEIILHVTPSKFVRDTIREYKQFVGDRPVVICSKGFESSTLYTLSEVAAEEMPKVKIGILSGPTHAEEVSIGIPTAIVVASKNIDVQYNVQDLFMSETMRVYTTSDVKGVELGGALKNIIAFCAGISVELNLGDNTLAALITRGLNEIARLGIAMGGNHKVGS